MTEAEIQKGIVRWARDMAVKHPCLARLHSIANGGARGRAARQGAGFVKGMPDLFLPFTRWAQMAPGCRGMKFCGGLYIEVKTAAGRLSDEQVACHDDLRGAGYRVVVVRSVEEAQWAILDYLEG